MASAVGRSHTQQGPGETGAPQPFCDHHHYTDNIQKRHAHGPSWMTGVLMAVAVKVAMAMVVVATVAVATEEEEEEEVVVVAAAFFPLSTTPKGGGQFGRALSALCSDVGAVWPPQHQTPSNSPQPHTHRHRRSFWGKSEPSLLLLD